MWAKATFALPARVKNGPSVQPVAMLSKDKALMVTSYAMRPIFFAYDRRTGRHQALATAPKWGECNLCYEIMSAAMNETQIAWTAGIYRSEPGNPGKRHMELWIMPRSGGQMRMVTWLTGPGDIPWGDELTITGDHAIWRSEDDTYRVPLAGGHPEKINPPAEPRPVKPDPEVRNFRCDVEWCVGRIRPRPDEVTTLVVQRRDGSGRATIAASSSERPLIGDRFGLFDPPYVYAGNSVHISTNDLGSNAVVYDRCTGKTAQVGAPQEDEGSAQVLQGATSPQEPILFWPTQSEKQYIVLDLSRISDQPCRN
ncbi:hypothetical protein [Streptosporangium sp. 'caverna']|uniref:hypothetical protein n=1 Tax=Streptosporangium sp. 'caverna' TaxID=2202249 RepID=UPI001EF84AAC|nr:hypothetical protein [Streptosporangium sp. 'caverna']